MTSACGRIGYDPLEGELRIVSSPGSGGSRTAGSGGATGGAFASDGGAVATGGSATGGGTSIEPDAGTSGAPGAPDGAAADAGSRDAAPGAEPDGTTGAAPDAGVSGQALAVGLVGYWKFDAVDLLGALTPDSSGNGNVGTLESFSPSDWQTGVQGRGIAFGAAWVTSAFTSSLNGIMAGVSVSAWVRVRGAAPGQGTVLERQVGQTAQAHFSLRLENGYVQFGGAAFGVCATTSAIANGQWVHLAGTFDGTTVNVYVGGALGASCPATALLSPDTTPVTIGAARNSSGPTTVVDAFTSIMDEVALFDRALPAPEVRALASGSVPVP